MGYELVMPPSRLDFDRMSKPELRQFFDWFRTVIPNRVRALEDAVRCSPELASWTADCSPRSLVGLGSWFANHVETRPRTQEETRAIYERAPGWFKTIEFDKTDLGHETVSLAVDVGMYVSQVFMRQMPHLRWELKLGSKRNVDFGQPVITGFGVMVFNPVRMLLTLAYGVAQGKHGGEALKDMYDYWAALAA